MSDFQYSKEKIDKIIKENNLSPVIMLGVKRDLQNLKPVIEQIYDEHIFYLSYWEGECGYHGWDWSEDNGRMKNQAKITDGITQKFLEIYALILAGLGEEMEEEDG